MRLRLFGENGGVLTRSDLTYREFGDVLIAVLALIETTLLQTTANVKRDAKDVVAFRDTGDIGSLGGAVAGNQYPGLSA